jgi:acyl carrier protein
MNVPQHEIEDIVRRGISAVLSGRIEAQTFTSDWLLGEPEGDNLRALNLDSLHALELVLYIEERAQIVFPEDIDASILKTVQDLFDLVSLIALAQHGGQRSEAVT